MSEERDQAERRYVAALVALDAAAQPPKALTEAAAAATAEVARLNRLWSGAARPSGLFGRIGLELSRLMPWNRRRLLGAMIAAANRQADAARALLDANQHFRSHVIWYAQTVAAFAGTARRQDLTGEDVERLQIGFNALQDHWLMHVESLGAREARSEARLTSMDSAYADLREALAVAQQQIQALRATGRTGPTGQTGPTGPAGSGTDDVDYVGFEERFRGSREEIRARLEPYVSLLAASSPVLEIGCGRGELLQLLREHDVTASGVDVNGAMVDACRSLGLSAERADALAHLGRQPDGSLGGIIAVQVVEHLRPGYLVRCLEGAFRSLKPGGKLVLETINPACWAAFFDGYIRDLTHEQPLHPDTLKYLTQAAGFVKIDVRYLSPVAESDRLQEVRFDAESAGASPVVRDLVEASNANAARLNRQLFSHRDYAIIATK